MSKVLVLSFPKVKLPSKLLIDKQKLHLLVLDFCSAKLFSWLFI